MVARKISRDKGQMFKKIHVYRSSLRWVDDSKENWAHISPGYVYLSYEGGRSYWIFSNGAKAKIKFVDNKQQININTYKIRFDRLQDYNYSKKCLQHYL